MEISYKNSFWDYVQFNWYVMLRSKLSLIVLLPALLIVGQLAVDAWRATDEQSFFVKIVVSSIFLITGFVVFLLLAMIMIFISSFLMYIGRNTKWDEAKIQVTENGLITEASVGRSEINWSGIKTIKENKRLIFIFLSAYMACIVPKRVFAQEADANKFFAYLHELWEQHKQ